jgi:hypothetical protein
LNGINVGVIGATTPKREIVIVFFGSQIRFKDVSMAPLGSSQRIQSSKYGPGLALLFDFEGINGVLTASGLDGVLETVALETPRPASTDSTL